MRPVIFWTKGALHMAQIHNHNHDTFNPQIVIICAQSEKAPNGERLFRCPAGYGSSPDLTPSEVHTTTTVLFDRKPDMFLFILIFVASW